MKPNVARCHLMARVLAADGIITPDERALLQATMDAAGLTAEERDAVIHFERTEGAERAVRGLSLAERQAFVDTLVGAALADHKLSPLETAEIDAIVAALNLSDGREEPTDG